MDLANSADLLRSLSPNYLSRDGHAYYDQVGIRRQCDADQYFILRDPKAIGIDVVLIFDPRARLVVVIAQRGCRGFADEIARREPVAE